MASEDTRRADALAAWLSTLDDGDKDSDQQPPKAIEAYYNPTLLANVCRTVDPDFFRDVLDDEHDHMPDLEDRLAGLQQVVGRVRAFYNNTIQQQIPDLPTSDLEAIAHKSDLESLVNLLKILLTMAVLSPRKEGQIKKVQSTPEWAQKELKLCIEEVQSRFSSPNPSSDSASSGFAEQPSDSLASYVELHAAHRALQNAHATLKADFHALQKEHTDTINDMGVQNREDNRRTLAEETKSETMLRSELESLQAELTKAESIIAESETATTRQNRTIEDLNKRLADLAAKAEQATHLKDEMDEYKHAAERLRKMESSVEKYKKRLEESAEIKRMLKILEDENMTLLEKNAKLEEDQQAVAQLHSLVGSYKASAEEHDIQMSELKKEVGAITHDLQESRSERDQLRREKLEHQEIVTLLEERVRELEGSQDIRPKVSKKGQAHDESGSDNEDSANELSGVANELDDAITGVSTTELKLQIRKLRRELDAIQGDKGGSSRVLILENLLEDAQKVKARYERDFLDEHRSKLILQKKLDQIQAGEAVDHNEAQAIAALRLRLADTLEQLDTAKKAEANLQVQLSDLSKELHLARSDLSLVNVDKLDMVASIRKSVSKETEGLEAEVKRLNADLAEARQTSNMQLSQINQLLLNTVDLQSQALDRKRSEIAASPGDERGIQNPANTDELDRLKDQLQKARNFIRQQDQLFKEQHKEQVMAKHGDHRTEVESLRSYLAQQRAINADLEQKYQKDQRILLTAYQNAGLEKLRDQILLNGQATSRAAPASWLAQQRARALQYTQ